jgi:hypothetical protein
MSFINDSLVILINIIHLIVIIFVLAAPFSNSNYLMLLHSIVIPFIILHWLLNNNTCCLTVAEKYIREKNTGTTVKEGDCFTYQLVAPIYDFNKDHQAFSTFIYILTISLWFVSVYNLSNKYCTNQIKSINDLCAI